MNSNNVWNKKQIEAYAASFRDKDAVYVKGYGWDEVAQVYDDEGGYNCVPYSFGTTNVDKHINSWQMRVGRKWIGYPEDFEENYEIITPKDYEAQAGDKLVWLGKTQKQGSRSELTFGKSYKVEQQGELVYKTDMNIATLARSEKDRWKFWGVIPKWKNVKKEVETAKFKMGDKVYHKRNYAVGIVEEGCFEPYFSFEDSDGKTETKIQFLEGEPEDMTFGRDLSDVFYITDMIKKAYELGRKGKPLEFEERIVKDE